ncbi:MAG: Hpt domain-containing protein [Deltaproteobacteria bacterium]|jgi:HPt (histidine-containing phosphotransfer) domain-containing protein|nr:Hpt domain-containing protein [Deltaproteobacteria bacterium]
MTVEIDKASICENFMDDEELIFESIDLFLESATARLKTLVEAVKERNDDKVMVEAHTLKGMVGIFSPGDVFDSAKKLESMGRNHDLTGVDEALIDFEDKLQTLMSILKEWREAGIDSE